MPDLAYNDVEIAFAHELRTPLTTIRSVSEILRDNPELPEAQRNRFLAALAEETEKLTGVIDRMLRAGAAGPDRWCVDAEDFLHGTRPASGERLCPKKAI